MRKAAIRKMRVSDLPEVMGIERESFSTPWSERLFLSEILREECVCLVAVVENRVAGYVTAIGLDNEAEIHKLAVSTPLRTRGIGKSLVRACVSELMASGCRKVFLEVRASNLAAIRLYTKAGFTVDGTRKAYYEEPVEDAVLMSFRTGKG